MCLIEIKQSQISAGFNLSWESECHLLIAVIWFFTFGYSFPPGSQTGEQQCYGGSCLGAGVRLFQWISGRDKLLQFQLEFSAQQLSGVGLQFGAVCKAPGLCAVSSVACTGAGSLSKASSLSECFPGNFHLSLRFANEAEIQMKGYALCSGLLSFSWEKKLVLNVNLSSSSKGEAAAAFPPSPTLTSLASLSCFFRWSEYSGWGKTSQRELHEQEGDREQINVFRRRRKTRVVSLL